MDPRVLERLEFDKVREILAAQASFSGGKSLALALEPSPSLREADRWQQETAEGLRLLEEHGPPPFGGMADVRPLVRRAAVGAVLSTEDLMVIADVARASRRLRDYLLEKGPGVGADVLVDLADLLGVYDRLEREVRRCIDQEGHVVDHASEKLAEIRARLRRLKQRVRERLEALVRSPQAQKYLQEPIITIRGGRYVVPVKQEHRSEIPGIVHDQSASGATLFVEPLLSVELNNEIREAEQHEASEVERILTMLSGLVAAEADSLIHTVEMAAEIDFIFAKARLASQWRAVRPRLNDQGVIRLYQARHPLLTGTVVPIDVHVGDEFSALVITGPNTGGKTVTLKTIGLFTLMAQAGLHLPAQEGSQVGAFRHVFADIGDEQSIEQSLSTFSSHMSNIVSILKKADESSLVLLDELGAGTDPTEGAALAIALLEHLIERGCRTVATTHYSELKAFAYTHPGARNASVEFDVRTLRPTYRLLVGVAGTSNAFAIAARLGLDRRIIDRAQSKLDADERRVDEVIRSVEIDKSAAARDRREAEKLRERYLVLSEKYHEAFERLKASREAILDEARREAQSILARAQREAEELLGRLRKAGAGPALEREAAAVRQSFARLARELEESERPVAPTRPPAPDPTQLRPGVTVRIRAFGQTGEVLEITGGKALVQAGPMRVAVDVNDLEIVRGAAAQPVAPQSSGKVSVTLEKATQLKPELDLRGLTVSEALEEVDKYLDDALLAGAPKVRIIHGKGTGALRDAIRRYLDGHPRVSEYRYAEQSEGGTGATEVLF